MLPYIILGIVQGLTEFLPVSSSGHLVVLQRLLGMRGQELAITVLLHLATSLAVVIFFWRDILKLFRNPRLIFFILLVTLITGIIGILGKDLFEKLFSAPQAVGWALSVTAIILIATRFFTAKAQDLTFKDAIILGIAQGIAIIPGISRAGITISTLLFLGKDRDTAFRISFLASIPAVLGAVLLEAKKINFSLTGKSLDLTLSFALSLCTGLAALGLLKLVLRKAKLYYFGYYCLLLSLLILFFIR